MPSTKAKFLLYSDYFAIAAESGLESTQSLFNLQDPINRVDLSTLDARDQATVREDMFRAAETAYQKSQISSESLQPMRDAFLGLAAWILDRNGKSVDAFITTQGIQVKNTYAKISTVLGETISSKNRR